MKSASTDINIVGKDFTAGFLQVVLFKWSMKKHCVANILQGTWETVLYENNCNYDSYKFCYKFAFIPFLSVS